MVFSSYQNIGSFIKFDHIDANSLNLYNGGGRNESYIVNTLSEDLRLALRQWTTGVCVVCSQQAENLHGMTVNSFTSVSLDPPIISVSLAKDTRTLHLVQESGKFSISILREDQKNIADRFAGKILDNGDRFKGLDTFVLPDGGIAFQNALAWLECRVRTQIVLENSTLYLADVTFASVYKTEKPLIYHNRRYLSI